MSLEICAAADVQSRLEGNIWKVVALKVLAMSMAFPVPIFGPFLESHGLGAGALIFLQALFALAMLLLEVPSGYVADLFGRKLTLVLGAVSLAGGGLAYCVAENFWGFLLGEVLLAAGHSFISGADQALLYDTLSVLGRQREFSRIWGRSMSTGMCYCAVACVLGGYMASVDVHLPYYVAAAGFSVLVLIMVLLEEPPVERRKVNGSHLSDLFGIMRYSLFENRTLGWLILYSAFIVGMLVAALWLYQPYFGLLEFPLYLYGWIFCGMNLVSAFVSWHAAELERRLGHAGTAALLVALLVLGFVLMGLFVAPFCVVLIGTQQIVRGANGVLFQAYLNELVTEDRRATTGSIRSMAERVMTIVLLVPSAWLVGKIGLPWMWLTLAGVALLLGTAVLWLRPKSSG